MDAGGCNSSNEDGLQKKPSCPQSPKVTAKGKCEKPNQKSNNNHRNFQVEKGSGAEYIHRFMF